MYQKSKAALALAAIAIGFSLTIASSSLSAQDQKARQDEKAAAPKLEGRYTIVSGEKDGKAIPEGDIKGSIVVFTADKIVGTDKDKKEFFASSYVLDAAHKPWLIKMKSNSPKEAEAMGLIKQDGDTVTLIYALPGGDAPQEFKTKDKQHLFVLKKTAGKRDEP